MDETRPSHDDDGVTGLVLRLVGVYDANGTLAGEVAYWIGARLGRRHCSLCDITHGTFRRRPAWDECRDGLPVRFDTYHRDDQPDGVRRVSGDTAPVVVADTDAGWVALLAPVDIDACNGSIDALVDAVERAVRENGLDWPSV